MEVDINELSQVKGIGRKTIEKVREYILDKNRENLIKEGKIEIPDIEFKRNHIYQGDTLNILRGLPSKKVQTCITSPPYWGLRSYLPDRVVLKKDAPEWVKKELRKRNIKPIDVE